MKKYLKLLNKIKSKGTNKPGAREGMPGSKSRFGHQMRINLQDGFPLLTTKKINFNHIVIELLWFLKGDTNIKYLIDNGVNIWNEDAYNYYIQKVEEITVYTNKPPEKLISYEDKKLREFTFTEFIEKIKSGEAIYENGYTLGDCGFQYGRVWRAWDTGESIVLGHDGNNNKFGTVVIDQIKNVINTLKNNPQSRRHLVTAIDPSHQNDLALYWCHSLFQFNARPLSEYDRKVLLGELPEFEGQFWMIDEDPCGTMMETCDEFNIPKYHLDCQMYQRSADVFLGVPYNIASYALLTHIIAKITNMIPGEFIHTFGDVHIYDNHKEQVNLQLTRVPTKLPKLVINKTDAFWNDFDVSMFGHLDVDDFSMLNYNPADRIKGKLSTGLK